MSSSKRLKYIKLFGVVLLGVLFVLLYIYLYRRYAIFKSPEDVRNFVLRYEHYGFIVYIALQVIQIVIFFIPGEIFQIAGGFIYGTVTGAVFSLLGIIIGSSISFFIAHKFGRAFVQKLLSKKQIWILERLENAGGNEKEQKRLNLLVFLLYLIPGIPKDILAYISGISQITYTDFIIYSTSGRIPALLVSLYFGEKLSRDNLALLIIIAIAMGILFVIGLVYGKRIINSLSKNDN